jgi:aminoglycoside/choline kinase family phosphotransferase
LGGDEGRRRALEIPFHPDAVTAGWLTDTLRAAGALAHAHVTSLKTQAFGGEKGLTGQLARLSLDYDSDAAEAPRSLVAKFSAADPQARALPHAMGFYEREVRFYQQNAARSPLRTPRCYFSAIDTATGLSLLLLEDLTAAANGNWVAGCSPAEAELAVRAIAPFHAAWWMHPQLEQQPWLELRGPTAAQQAPAFFQQTWRPFLDKLGSHITDEIRQVGVWLDAHLGRLGAHLYHEPPRTLIHNDYQADNLFFAGSGDTRSLVVADWQLSTQGRAAYDVAYFLAGNLDARHRREHELRLLRGYHTLLVEHGVRDYPFEQCWDDYRLAMLQPLSRLIAVIGIGVVPPAQEHGFCEVLVPRYCRAVHDLKVGELLSAVF